MSVSVSVSVSVRASERACVRARTYYSRDQMQSII